MWLGSMQIAKALEFVYINVDEWFVERYRKQKYAVDKRYRERLLHTCCNFVSEIMLWSMAIGISLNVYEGMFLGDWG